MHFDPWETTATVTISAYVDGVAESGTDTLKAELVGNTAYTAGTPSSVDVEIDDPPSGSTLVTVARDQPSIREGETGTFTLTRTGGDTTQELTVNLRVDDTGEYLRGNHYDPAPIYPPRRPSRPTPPRPRCPSPRPTMTATSPQMPG